MKNLGLLNKKMSGWKPIDAVIYLRTCKNDSEEETEFVNLLCRAMQVIDATATHKRIFLYNSPSSEWDAETMRGLEQSELLFNENVDQDATVMLRRFQPEPDYVYFLLEASQFDEEVELLFLEELK